MNKIIFAAFIFLIFLTGCKGGSLVNTSSSTSLSVASQELQDYSSQTLDLLVKGDVTVAGVEPLHRVYFYLNSTCNGSPVGQVVVQSLPTNGVHLSLPNSAESSVYFRTDTSSQCYLGLTYTPHLDPVPPPTYVTALPPSPSTSRTPAIKGVAFPNASHVDFYSDASCATSIGSGEALTFINQGVVLNLAAEATTAVYSTITDPRGHKSACALLTNYGNSNASADPVSFVNTSPLSPSNVQLKPLVRLNAGSSIATINLFSNSSCTTALGNGDRATATSTGIEVTVPADQTTQIYGVGIDDQGKSSACLFLTTYVHDTNAPTNPSYTSANPSTPTRSTTLPKIIGVAPADAAWVRLYNTSACTQMIGFGPRSQFMGTGVNANISANAVTDIYATSVDAAGNSSNCVLMLSYTHNSTPPPVPVFGYSIPESPTNISNTPVIFGTTSGTATQVHLWSDNTCSVSLGSASAAGFEASGIQVTVPMNAETLIYATSEDSIGNTSECISLTSFLHSDTPATPPTYLTSYPLSPSKTTNHPYISGTAPSTVQSVSLYTDNSCSVLLGTASLGTFSTAGIRVTVPTDSATDIYGQSQDIFGNNSVCVHLTTFIHTTIAPTNPIYTNTTPISPSNASFTPTIFGTVFANIASPLPPNLVRFFDSDSCVGNIGQGTPAALSGVGILLSLPQNSVSTIYARVYDAANNAS